MERKIGEIFKYLDEWYQCLEEKTCTCFGCDFSHHNCNDINLRKVKGSCQSNHRSDKKSVIFKKLEKIGEPFVYEKKTCQTYQLYTPTRLKMQPDEVQAISVDRGNYTADIEIKQNKKDMEGNKSMKEKLKEYLETATEEQLKNDFEVLKKFNESGIPVKEFIESQMSHHLKPFDLEAAKAGKPICTRDGSKAIFLTTLQNKRFPVVAVVNCEQEENIYQYDINGICDENIDTLDLMMLTEKKEGWVNVYKTFEGGRPAPCIASIYPTKEDAKKSTVVGFIYVDTVPIVWRE